MVSPLISFIIPVYNRAKQLQSCISSVINAHLKEYEIILVDDGSTDETSALCDVYMSENKNIHTIHQENMGVGVAKDVGLKAATGEYVFFLDSDDEICSEAFAQFIEEKHKWYGVDLVCFHYLIDTKEKCSIYCIDEKTGLHENWCHTVEIAEVPPYMWTYVFNRKFLFNHHISVPHIRSGEDIIFVVQSHMIANRVYVFDKPLYKYTICDDHTSLSKTKSVEDICFSISTLLEIRNKCRYKNDTFSSIVRRLCLEALTCNKDEIYFSKETNLYKISYNEIEMYWNRFIKNLEINSNNFKKKLFICPAGASAAITNKIISSGGKVSGFLDNFKTGNLEIQNNKKSNSYPVFPITYLSQIKKPENICIALVSTNSGLIKTLKNQIIKANAILESQIVIF